MGAVAAQPEGKEDRKTKYRAVASEVRAAVEMGGWSTYFYICAAAHCLAGEAEDFCLLFLVVKERG